MSKFAPLCTGGANYFKLKQNKMGSEKISYKKLIGLPIVILVTLLLFFVRHHFSGLMP